MVALPGAVSEELGAEEGSSEAVSSSLHALAANAETDLERNGKAEESKLAEQAEKRIAGLLDENAEWLATDPHAKALRDKLDKMLENMLKMRWAFRRVSAYTHKLALFFVIAFAGSACITAALHAFLSLEDFKHTITIVSVIAGLHSGLVGIYSYLKPGHVSAECNVAAKAYDHVIQRLRIMLMDPKLSVADLKECIKEMENTLRSVMHSVSHQPPKWVLDEVAKVPLEQLFTRG